MIEKYKIIIDLYTWNNTIHIGKFKFVTVSTKNNGLTIQHSSFIISFFFLSTKICNGKIKSAQHTILQPMQYIRAKFKNSLGKINCRRPIFISFYVGAFFFTSVRVIILKSLKNENNNLLVIYACLAFKRSHHCRSMT